MPSEVLYRKWRPQKLGDVVGQEPITRTLQNALITGRIAHAYLFFGPRGTGKTSTGRILAKALDCLDNQTGEPCNACAICQAFNEGRAIDLIEIDAASNTGVDDIRDLKEKINFAPNVAKYKVYIIDEVHMLSTSAFNALLKTLEEPPPHVIFILATTEVHKVPPTITSRCQRFDFRRIPQSAAIGRLEYICEQEGITAEPQAMDLIARSATGSLRDAINLLEQMVVYHGPNIELQHVRTELGLTGDARIKKLASSILRRDITEGIALINSITADGLDVKHFNRELVDYLRQMMLIKADAPESTNLSDEEIAEITEIAADGSLDEISQATKRFAQADFRLSAEATLPLELALIDHTLSVAEASQGPVSVQPKQEKPAQMPIAHPSPPTDSPHPPETKEAVVVATPATPDIEYIRQHWVEFVNACRGAGAKGNLDALLRGCCKPISLENDTLTLGFSAEFHRSKIEDPRYGQIVEKKLKEVFGNPYRIVCVLTGKENMPAAPSAKESPLVKEALRHGAKIISEE